MQVHKTAGKFNQPLKQFKQEGGWVECFWCELRVLADKITIDHVIPKCYKNKKELYDYERTVASCYNCNQKRSKIPHEYGNRQNRLKALRQCPCEVSRYARLCEYNAKIQLVINRQREVCKMEIQKLGYSVSDILLIETIMPWEI